MRQSKLSDLLVAGRMELHSRGLAKESDLSESWGSIGAGRTRSGDSRRAEAFRFWEAPIRKSGKVM
jgi:hypothetical protein